MSRDMGNGVKEHQAVGGCTVEQEERGSQYLRVEEWIEDGKVTSNFSILFLKGKKKVFLMRKWNNTPTRRSASIYSNSLDSTQSKLKSSLKQVRVD